MKDFLPELLAIAEFSTGETMGQNADRMEAKFGVSRYDQDVFAMRSHHLASKATKDGLLDKELIPVSIPSSFKKITHDNGIHADTSLEKLGTLRPAFTKPH